MRNVPILRAAFIVMLVYTAVWGLINVAELNGHSSLFFALNGMQLVVEVMLAIGALELASRIRGWAAFGAKLAAAGFGLHFALSFARFAVLSIAAGSHELDRWFGWIGWVTVGASVLVVVGFVTAAWANRRAAIGGGVVAIGAVVASWVVPAVMRDSFSTETWRWYQVLLDAIIIVRTLALMWLAASARPAAPIPTAPLATAGLRWMSRALWLRLIGGLVFAFVAMAVVGVGTDGSDTETFKRALIAAMAIEVVVLGAFGLGALGLARAALDTTPRWPFIAAGLAAVWCACLTLLRIPFAYQSLLGTRGFWGIDIVDELTLVEPVVALAAIAAIAAGIRAIPELRDTAPRAGMFVVMMTGSVALASFGVEHATTAGELLGIHLFGGLLSILATALVARQLTSAGELLDLERPNLPTAKVVE